MKTKSLKLASLTVFLVMIASIAYSGVPQLISYQGYVTDSSGNPLDGTYSMIFRIHAAPGGPGSLWSETQSVDVSEGRFSVFLGSVTELTDNLFSDTARYLGVTVEGEDQTPRSRMTTSPFAYRIATVDGSVSSKLVLDDGTSTRVELGVGSDVLKVYDENDDLRVRLSITDTGVKDGRGLDGGGAISFFPAGFLKRGEQDKSADPDSGSLIRLGESIEGAGEINIFDTAGNEIARMTSTDKDAGAFYTYWNDGTVLTLQGQSADTGGYIANHGTNGERSASLTSIVGLPGHGAVGTFDTLGNLRSGIFTDAGADGHLYLINHEDNLSIEMTNYGDTAIAQGGLVRAYGPNGIKNAEIGQWFDDPNDGLFGLYDQDGNRTVEMSNYGDTLNPEGAYTHVYGPNGNLNCALWYLGGFPNNGYLEVFDSNGTSKAGMYVNSSGDGVLYSDLKSSRVTNPSKQGTELMFSSLEGPEAGAYIRGTTRLENGKAVIYFPEYFVNVASPEGMTVQVVPLSADSRGLAVTEKHADHIVVQELMDGNGYYEFDYTITAVRKGYENYQVVRAIVDRMPSKPNAKSNVQTLDPAKSKKVELVGPRTPVNDSNR